MIRDSWDRCEGNVSVSRTVYDGEGGKYEGERDEEGKSTFSQKVPSPHFLWLVRHNEPQNDPATFCGL